MKKQNQVEAMRAKLGPLTGNKPRKSIFDVGPTPEPAIEAPKEALKIEEVPQVAAKKPAIKSGAVAAPKALVKDRFHDVNVPMPTELLDMIQDGAKAINRNGLTKAGRITASSIMRSLLSVYEEIEVDFSGVDSEESLNIAVKSAIKARMRG